MEEILLVESLADKEAIFVVSDAIILLSFLDVLPYTTQHLQKRCPRNWQNQVVKKASWMEELRKNNLQWFTETISMFSFLPISVQLSFILC